jgi:hypothetical protein
MVVATLNVGPVLAGHVREHASKSSPTVQLGLDTYFTYHCQPASTIESWADVEVGQFKALGANSIGISFPLYTSSMTSNDVFARTVCSGTAYESPPTSILSVVVSAAHAAGLTVLLRPMIDEANLVAQDPKAFRGNIEPTKLSTWFKNYTATLMPYLAMAQEQHVEFFSMETELDSLADRSNWTSMVLQFRKTYTGSLVWNYSWSTSVKKLRRAHTSLSVDAYPILKSVSPEASTSTLLKAWNDLLKDSGRYGIPSISDASIDEVGIAAQDGAYAYPTQAVLEPVSEYPFNQQIQANWFTAACSFMKQHGMNGIYFWGSFLTADGGSLPTSPDPQMPTAIQPSAAQSIARCFSSG